MINILKIIKEKIRYYLYLIRLIEYCESNLFYSKFDFIFIQMWLRMRFYEFKMYTKNKDFILVFKNDKFKLLKYEKW
jgi:hypothetical protein